MNPQTKLMPEASTPLAQGPEPEPRQRVLLVERLRKRRYWLHGLLLILTLLTTLTVGARLEYNFQHDLPAFTSETYVLPPLLARHSTEPVLIDLPFPLKWVWEHPQRLGLGIPFAFTLMGILLAHEMGHFVYCQRYGVYATLPYFLPGPLLSPIGTFGAVIRIKSPIRNRQALFDIGIAGPIAGFVVAVPVLLAGLALSKPLLPQASGSLINFGFPLVFHLAHWALHGLAPQVPPLGSIYLHPVGVAAWVGMLATALNLLPGGQLDGGHLVYSVAPRAHRRVTLAAVVALIVLSRLWYGWLIWAMILGLIARRHPAVPVWPDLDARRKAWSLVAVLLLALTWTPVPILLSN